MTREIFEDGDILYAAQVNEIAYPRLDGLAFIGHGDLITDLNMSDAPENIKARFYTWYNRFRVTINSGRIVNISAGVIQSGGIRVSFPAGTYTIPASSTGYLYIGTTSSDSTIAIRFASQLPRNSIPLARVVTNATSILEVTDIRDITAIPLPPAIPDAVPVGTPIFSLLPPSVSSIDGYVELLENSQNISRVTYSALFNLFGTFYGEGDGSTTFGIPGIGGLLFRGLNTGDSVGSILGSNSFSILNANLPPHLHGIVAVNHTHGVSQTAHTHGVSQTAHTHGINDPGHAHALSGFTYDTNAGEGSDGDGSAFLPVASGTAIAGTGITNVAANANITVNTANANITINQVSHGITQTQNTGEGQPIEFTPRSLVVRVFLKV